MSYEPRYSGPNRSGICRCGHHWSDHHCSMVMRKEYSEEIGEVYIPDECCFYGSNEVGGLMYDKEKEEWVDHCRGYVDSMEVASGIE